MPLKVILADDHPVVLIGLQAVLQKNGLAEVVGEASSADEVWELLGKTPCDVLITDYSMPGGERGSGLSLIGQIRRTYPDLPIVIVTMISNPALLRAMMEAGANAVLGKTTCAEELPLALRSVLAGKRYLGAAVRAAFDASSQEGSRTATAEASLSSREAEVLRLYISGLSVSDIAKRLNRSIKTVSHHKVNAMRKLGLGSDAELHAYAKDSGMLS